MGDDFFKHLSKDSPIKGHDESEDARIRAALAEAVRTTLEQLPLENPDDYPIRGHDEAEDATVKAALAEAVRTSLPPASSGDQEDAIRGHDGSEDARIKAALAEAVRNTSPPASSLSPLGEISDNYKTLVQSELADTACPKSTKNILKEKEENQSEVAGPGRVESMEKALDEIEKYELGKLEYAQKVTASYESMKRKFMDLMDDIEKFKLENAELETELKDATSNESTEDILNEKKENLQESLEGAAAYESMEDKLSKKKEKENQNPDHKYKK